MSLGGSANKSSSQAQSNKFGLQLGQTYLDPAQQANQQQLANQFFSAQQGIPNQFGNMTSSLLNQNRHLATIDQSQGSQLLGQFAQQQNPYLQAQINQFGGDIGRQYGILSNQIGGDFQQAGQRGSSRHGVAQGLLGQEAFRQFGQGVTNLRSGAYGQQQQAAGQFADAQAQIRQQQLGAIGQGLGGIAQAQQNYFQPFQIGSQVIGAPSILSSQFGLDLAESTARSKGKGAGFNIGFGT